MTAPGELTEKQKASGVYSDLADIEVGPSELRCSVIAPQGVESSQPLPTILAISGEEQLHVSLFVRAWRAERRGWQVVAAAREGKDCPYLFEKVGVELLAKLTRGILKGRECPALRPVEGRKLHLVGISNGGASVLALAARMSDQIASVTLVTGFIPECLKDLGPLRKVPRIRLFGSKQDLKVLQVVQEQLELAKAPLDDLHIVKGANHSNVGQHLDMEAFWGWLEGYRPIAAVEPVLQAAVESVQQEQLAEVAEAIPAAVSGATSSAIGAAGETCSDALNALQATRDQVAAAADMEDGRLPAVLEACHGRQRRRKGKAKLDEEQA